MGNPLLPSISGVSLLGKKEVTSLTPVLDVDAPHNSIGFKQNVLFASFHYYIVLFFEQKLETEIGGSY